MNIVDSVKIITLYCCYTREVIIIIIIIIAVFHNSFTTSCSHRCLKHEMQQCRNVSELRLSQRCEEYLSLLTSDAVLMGSVQYSVQLL